MEKDAFDYIEESEEPPDRSGTVWNILTVLVLIAAVGVGIVYLIILINPNVGINPFPPPDMPVRAALDTPTPTVVSILPPTWTPTASPVPVETSTPVPTSTPLPTQEEAAATQEEESTTPDEDLEGDFPVVLHDGSPQYIPATSFHPDVGCNWMGVAGQVIDVNGAPVQGLIVEVGGTLDGETIGNPTILQATGLATAYGEAGFEIKLADAPIESAASVWIQVLDQAGLPLSEQISFFTFDDCERNLIIIYFKQVR